MKPAVAHMRAFRCKVRAEVPDKEVRLSKERPVWEFYCYQNSTECIENDERWPNCLQRSLLYRGENIYDMKMLKRTVWINKNDVDAFTADEHDGLVLDDLVEGSKSEPPGVPVQPLEEAEQEQKGDSPVAVGEERDHGDEHDAKEFPTTEHMPRRSTRMRRTH